MHVVRNVICWTSSWLWSSYSSQLIIPFFWALCNLACAFVIFQLKAGGTAELESVASRLEKLEADLQHLLTTLEGFQSAQSERIFNMGGCSIF